MRGSAGLAVLLVVAVLGSDLLGGRVVAAHPGPVRSFEPVPISADLAVSPPPDGFANNSRPVIAVRVINDSFVPRLDRTDFSLDGRRLLPLWIPENRTLVAVPEEALAEGDHYVNIALQNDAGTTVRGSWRFTQDTVPPRIDFEPLPDVAEKRVFTVNGTVEEPHLQDVRVNGVAAIFEEGRFRAPVLLWPGPNDLLAVATDHANNRGLAAAGIRWSPPSPENQTYLPFVHSNASFVTRFPDDWEVALDRELEEGFRAQVVTSSPPLGPYRSSIAIVSRPVGEAMTQALLLAILEDSIARIGADAKIDVVSRPRIGPLVPRLVTAQFSVVETLPEGQRVFRQVTGYWSQTLSRIWLVLGSLPAEAIEEHWHAVETATGEFRVVEPQAPTEPGGTPKAAVDRAFFVTVGAIAFVVLFFAAGLYSLRHRPRRALRRVLWR